MIPFLLSANESDADGTIDFAEFEKMFEKLDLDGNGVISLQEIEAAPPELADELAKCFQTDDLVELFGILDLDQVGKVSIKEFCQELVKVVVSERSIDQVRTQKSMMGLRNNMNDLRGELRTQKESVDNICSELHDQRRKIAAMHA